MTLTYAIPHAIGGTTESVLVEVAEKSSLVLVSSDYDKSTNENVATYRIATGDTVYRATVVYTAGDQLRAGKPVRFVTMTFTTWATESDDVAGTVRYEPISAKISLTIPTSFTVELADLDDFIGTMFSFLYASQSSGARSTTYLSKLLYGIPQVV